MKKNNLTILLILSSCIFIYSQSIKKEKIIFTYTKLPLKPLDGLSSYYFKVNTPYPENNDDIIQFSKDKYENDLANYPNTVKESEEKYQELLENYESDVKLARENFKIESEEFNKLSLVERLALSDKKPTLKLPRKPIYRKPYKPIFRQPNLSTTIVFNPEVLANTYLNIEGIEKELSEDNNLYGEVILYDFEYLEPERKVKEETYYDTSAKATKKRTITYYTSSFKRPTNLKLVYNGDVIFDDLFSSTKNFKKIETKSKPSKLNLEKKSVQETLLEINNYLNNLYGFKKIGVSTNVRYVKNKKGVYDDIENAFNYAKTGYSNFNVENQNLKKAIEIWEKALEQSNVNEKKARIDKKVTIAILLNLLEAYTYNNNIERAKLKLTKLEQLDLNYNDKEFLKSFKLTMKDKEKRLESNGKL